jgi:hypothetical protein
VISTLAQALALLREQKVLPLTAVKSLRALTNEVAGETVRGSWWAHPRGKAIFNLAGQLDDSDEVISLKLVAGKITFVHASLWPPLLRVVTDEGWRAARIPKLSAPARRLLAQVEEHGERPAPSGAVKKELETSLLVLAQTFHTEKGAHATRFVSWTHWAKPALRKQAAALGFDEAMDELEKACAGESTLLHGVAPKRRQK